MNTPHQHQNDSRYRPARRNFLTNLSRAASILGLTTFVPHPDLQAGSRKASRSDNDLDAWFNKIKGSHKILYDAHTPNNGFQVVWSWVFLDTNNETGTSDHDLTVLVVLRHRAVGLALDDRLWKKYKLGKFFDVRDLTTPVPADKNPYWNPQAGEMPEAGMSMVNLLERGVLFCVCERAIANTSKMISQSKGLNAEDVKNELMAGVLPGIQPVPSGVWAIERAQQRGCAYCFAG